MCGAGAAHVKGGVRSGPWEAADGRASGPLSGNRGEADVWVCFTVLSAQLRFHVTKASADRD